MEKRYNFTDDKIIQLANMASRAADPPATYQSTRELKGGKFKLEHQTRAL